MTTDANRPNGCRGKGDSHLQRIRHDLRQVLSVLQDDFIHDTLCMDDDELDDLAGILVDFAEDLHNDIGIWSAFEQYNEDFFGVALPIIDIDGDDEKLDINSDRVRYLLWIVYPELLDEIILSPSHADLSVVAEVTSRFLRDEFASVPRDSGVKKFLQTSNEHGWDVKRKLLWLGGQSYMFRLFFSKYLVDNDEGRSYIAYTDDFICQECTRWSGLGVIDILARVLDISEDDRNDLRSWYERHAAFYKLLSVKNDALDVLNVINDKQYHVTFDMPSHSFKPRQLVFGSLVPWRGRWYWSGEQQLFGDASQIDVAELTQNMKRQSPQIVCRYCKDHELLVRQHASRLHENTIAYYGSDLILYQDGLSMAADWQKEFRQQWESRDQDCRKELKGKHGLTDDCPKMSIPEQLLELENGLAVFLDPDEGKEIMSEFTLIIAGLERRGQPLSDDERRYVVDFFLDGSISPKFVRRVLDEYGSESVQTAFLLRGDMPDYGIDFLLRSNKGFYYRKRYPSLSVI